MTDFPCVPVCWTCRDAGVCDAPSTALVRKPVRVRQKPQEWRPSALPLVRANCGCCLIPWPLFKVLGEYIDKVFCERHGWQAFRTATLLDRIKEIDPEWYARIKNRKKIEGERPMF